jgi:hypothetical protein
MVGGWFCVAVGSTDTPPRGFLYAACAPPARACDLGRSEPAKRLRLNYVNQLKGQA